MATAAPPPSPRPAHRYKDADKYIVVLNVEGPAGKARMARVWDAAVK